MAYNPDVYPDTYSPEQVRVLIRDGSGAQYAITGFADGTFITAGPTEDKWSEHVGAKGEGTWVLNLNQVGEITFTLKHNSPANAVLQELYNNREVFQVEIVDKNTGIENRVGGNNARVVNPGEFSRGPEIEDREWTIRVMDFSEDFKQIT